MALKTVAELPRVPETPSALAPPAVAPAPPEPWAEPLADPQEECERLARFLVPLAAAFEELHAHGLVCLAFDPKRLEHLTPANIQASMRWTDFQAAAYPAGQLPQEVPYKATFVAPETVHELANDIGPRTDVFHLTMFAYYWLARLLPKGFAGEGLAAISYQIPKLRTYAPRMPAGIAGVLARGLAFYPSDRYATPAALVDAFQEALRRGRERLAFREAVHWDIGADTRTGRTKAALHRDNEDRVLVRPFNEGERVLIAVADGVSTCDVGSGALASLIASIVLENAFDDKTTRALFAEEIPKVCRHCADTLLDWAVEKGYAQQLKEGGDLMGSTLTAGWLEGNTLTLANVGDSRAYLIDEHNVEQLTVDGDLASGMLAGGMAPEAIREVGPIAKALRECIGGCAINSAGEVAILDECCRPTITTWHLVPGDIVVLCSDGLVEEGAFLEPEALGEIVRANRHLPARELATLLCQKADELNRLPSLLEPEGFGDNISCIVIKIEAA